MKKITVNINLVKSASYSDPNPFKKIRKVFLLEPFTVCKYVSITQLYTGWGRAQLIQTYLVRFGGAGAVFPFLFVVRLICTKLLLEPPVNVVNLVAIVLKLSAHLKYTLIHGLENVTEIRLTGGILLGKPH